ncbi:MAG: Catalase [Nocardioides sp.]|nr:Catalase [Nocardioides sp.]
MSDTNDRDVPVTTTDAGIPATSDHHSLTVGPDGPILLQDHYVIQKMAHFNRERVPERVVHAKGSGAFGLLEITEDVSDFTKADLFQPGRRTETLARFSTVAGEQGSPDTWRDPRGFALKFYTREGNYDMVGNDTPVFFIRDPQNFSDFIHSQKRRQDSQLRDNNMQWDFWSSKPESAHMVTWLMGDRGIPSSYRHMDGFSSHTYLWENAAGVRHWVKYHFKTDQGIGFLSQADADRIAGEDSDYHRRDLFEHIGAGNAPSWTLSVQLMPIADAPDYRFNPFDLTKVWPHADYPLVKVGRMVLNRNPENFFAQIEQAAFEPANLVPGIGASPDKMLQGRLFSYPDTHRYRIGPNYLQLPVNQPKVPVHSYNRDGHMSYLNGGDPTYAPNSYGGPVADPACEIPSWQVEAGEMVRNAYTLHSEDDDFGQAGTLVRDVMDDAARGRLASNIVGHLSNGVMEPVLSRSIAYWHNVDADLGAHVAAGLGFELPRDKRSVA